MAMDQEARSLLQQLRTGEAQTRYYAAQALGRAEPRLEVLEGLARALADDGEWEWPGDPGAPPLYYSVATAARDALGVNACRVLPVLAETMRSSPLAAQQGASLLPSCGEAGARVLLELLTHPHEWGRKGAVQTVRAQLAAFPHPELFPALLRCLDDPQPEVRSSANHELGCLLKEQPGLHPVDQAPNGLVVRLLARLESEPESGTAVAATAWFLEDPRVLQVWVRLAAGGASAPAKSLAQHVDRLQPDDVELLIQAPLTPALVDLLGALGDRASGAVPRLLAMPPEPRVTVALFRIPRAWRAVYDRVPGLFLAGSLREQLVHLHPCPADLAAEVIGPLKERWEREHDAEALRGLQALGRHAMGELPWLLQFLEPYHAHKIATWTAVDLIATFGEEARPAFDRMATLLDHTDHRGVVLKALARLGPVASEDFLPLLEVMDLESQRWLVWQRNYWRGPLDAALAALRGS